MLDIQRLIPLFAIPAACLLAAVASFAQDVRFAPSAGTAIMGLGTMRTGTAVVARDGCCQPSWVPTFGGEPGVNADVWASTVFDDGSGPALHAAGDLVLNGHLEHIAKWNGSTWAPLASGMNGYVYALMGFDDGSGPAL